MDHHVSYAITTGLRLRNIDVVTAFEDQSHEIPDEQLLLRAHELNRVLFSQDKDFLRITTQFHKHRLEFSGLVYAHRLRVSISQCVQDLEIIAALGSPEELKNQVIYLPL